MLRRPKTPLIQHKEEKEITPSMRNANVKRIRFWHFHLDSSRAGPSYFQKFTLFRSPRLLRTSPPRPPPPYSISNQWKAVKPDVAQGTPRVCEELDSFLSAHYTRTPSFTYTKGSIPWISMLNDPSHVVLLLRNPEGSICGTVVSRAHSGTFGFLCNTINPEPRTVEFLCIHPYIRSCGLAGWMLAWLDSITHQRYGPCVHMGWWPSTKRWSSSPSPPLTQIRHYTKPIEQPLRSYEKELIHSVEPHSAHLVIEEIVRNPIQEWSSDIGSSVETYYSPTTPIQWWVYTRPDLMGCSVLVGIAPTPFTTKDGGRVSQVVFCSFVRRRPGNVNDLSMPFWDDSISYKDVPKEAIELALCAQGANVGIVTSIESHYGGGRVPSEWKEWKKLPERSNLMLYNWMPPFFHNQNLLWLSSTL